MAKRRTNSVTEVEKEQLEKFGAKIKSLREKQGLSVYDLTGEDMPIRSRQHWHRIENGEKNISITTLLKIAETLEVSVCELFKK